jgi:transcription initiation factor TFIIIB Brf1 subunit/transcription initiation factor TFIIB
MVSFNIQKCQSCEGDLVTDNITKEVFCKKCGLMIKQTDISLEPEHYSMNLQKVELVTKFQTSTTIMVFQPLSAM